MRLHRAIQRLAVSATFFTIFLLPIDVGAQGLGVTTEQLLEAATASGFLRRENFEQSTENGIVTGVLKSDEYALAVWSVGDPGDLTEIRIFFNTHPHGVEDRVFATVPDILDLLLENPGFHRDQISEFLKNAKVARAPWFFRSWLEVWERYGDPGARVEQVREGKLFIFEGVVPDFFYLTILRTDEREPEHDIEASSDPRSQLAWARFALRRGDYERARQILDHLASAGNPDAQNLLGEILLHGRGVARDVEKALEWLRLAAD